MKVTKKVTAFTLIELIVVMLLTSLLVTALWWSYGVLQKYFGENLKKNEQAEQAMVFYNQLSEDFYGCHHVKRVANDITCIFSNREIYYRLTSTNLIRKQGDRTDTLKVSHPNYVYTPLNGKHDDIIQMVEIKFEMSKRLIRFLIRKEYDATYRFQLDMQ
jgi:type II secretory pathway pseudopilin PulG